MITIGIELNHVIRNINKQIAKYYAKEYTIDVDLDDIDDKENILDTFAKFEDKYKKYNFIYIDYPFECFAAAKPVDNKLPTQINNWLVELDNREDEEFRIVYYSLYEDALTIQSTFFFLSKIGTRVREVFFPKNLDEIWKHCDVVITTNKEVIDNKPSDKQTIKIIGNGNQEDGSVGNFEYNSLAEVIQDEKFLDKIKYRKQLKKEE